MTKFSLVFIALASVAFATPVPEPNPEPQISLPGSLIPSIPGVTDPIVSGLSLPLPVLQLPTPPLSSPGFVGSNIKPKKIGYFWTGAGDNEHAGM